MAEFLTTKGISYHIDDIIKKADKELYILSPYLKISKLYADRLKEADKKGVTIFSIYRDKEIEPEQKKVLTLLKHSASFYCKDLHAKCYKNEIDIVVTSMNMFEYSEVNNREMGIWINKYNDPVMFKDASEEIKSILNISQPDAETISKYQTLIAAKPKMEKTTATAHQIAQPQHQYNALNYCPRCGKPLIQRIAKDGKHKGETFIGCSGFPRCRFMYPITK